MPSVSKAQHRFFGFLKGNPEEAKRRGISSKVVEEFATTKEKGLPERKAPGFGRKKNAARFR